MPELGDESWRNEGLLMNRLICTMEWIDSLSPNDITSEKGCRLAVDRNGSDLR